jgi:hypothetical protein
MMPTKLVKLGVAMLSNAVPQLLRFFNKLLTGHSVQVVIHWKPPAPGLSG